MAKLLGILLVEKCRDDSSDASLEKTGASAVTGGAENDDEDAGGAG